MTEPLTVEDRAEKLAKFLDFHIGEQVGNQVRGIAAAVRADERAKIEDLRTCIEALAERWRYKGEFGWGNWQEGEGPDQEGWVLDGAAKELRAILSLVEDRKPA